MKKSTLASYIIVSLLCLYALGAFYIPLLGSYFYADDTQCLWFAATKSIDEMFFSPDDYRVLSGNSFTPMVGITFKVDWLLFGMNPKGYYVHNLIAVLLTGIALFAFLKIYTDTATALFGFLLYLLNPLVLSVFSWCSSRHYLEGMFFALLSLYLHVKANRAERVSVMSGGFYLLSSLYKELYVALPAIAVIISRGPLTQRIRNTAHLWGILFLYIAWRFWMLGGIGGYPLEESFSMTSLMKGIYNILKFSPHHFLGSFSVVYWLIIPLMLLTSDRKNILHATLIFLIFLLPLVQVSWLIDSYYLWARYIVHISIFMIFLMTVWAGQIMKTGAWKKAAMLIFLFALAGMFIVRDYNLKKYIIIEREISARTAREYIYSGKPYIDAKTVMWFYEGLDVLYEYLYNRKIPTKIVPPPPYVKYLSQERLNDIESTGYKIDKNLINAELKHDVITGSMRIDGYRITWDLGPFEEGTYIILRGKYKGLFNAIHKVNRKGMHHFGKYFPLNRPDIFSIRVLYQSPGGWEAITDEYRVKIPGDRTINFNVKS